MLKGAFADENGSFEVFGGDGEDFEGGGHCCDWKGVYDGGGGWSGFKWWRRWEEIDG